MTPGTQPVGTIYGSSGAPSIESRHSVHVQGRINDGAKRAMAQGPPPRRKGPPAPQKNFF